MDNRDYYRVYKCTKCNYIHRLWEGCEPKDFVCTKCGGENYRKAVGYRKIDSTPIRWYDFLTFGLSWHWRDVDNRTVWIEKE